MLQRNTIDDVVLALAAAPVDPRTGNRVLYSVDWLADQDSMIGEINKDWVRRELAWFNSGSDRLKDMEGPVPALFVACAGDDPQGRVNSAYGHILFGHDDPFEPVRVGLFDAAVRAFEMEGKSTRHSVAIISDRQVHRLARLNGRNDFICTNALNFMIDAEDRLHIMAQMRSMDAVFGYRADYSMWDNLMEHMLGYLSMSFPELKRGDITFQVANLHVYPRHFRLLKETADLIRELANQGARRWPDRESAPSGNPYANIRD